MTGLLAHICRHPIKSIGWEALPSVDLTAGKALPSDRKWALAHQAAEFSAPPDKWYAKRNFVRGVAAPALMAVRATLSDDLNWIALTHPNAAPIEFAPDTEAGSAALVAWIAPMWPENRPAPARLVRVPDQAMTDRPEPFVSILNVESNRDLGARVGQDLSIHRWRGNLWLDGVAPFEEFDWIGRRIRIGNAVLRIEQRITRCNATKANPATGIADIDTLGALKAAFGHQDFGVYARVVAGGHLHLGDRIELL
ncbi:MOSC domain-containing protein [Tropicimonas sp.]|uniref:MOSC domain-containing protein n=1 Tax=Tropicimonas sp. TaxID=2067044 RepID=UPI003A8459B5